MIILTVQLPRFALNSLYLFCQTCSSSLKVGPVLILFSNAILKSNHSNFELKLLFHDLDILKIKILKVYTMIIKTFLFIIK